MVVFLWVSNEKKPARSTSTHEPKSIIVVLVEVQAAEEQAHVLRLGQLSHGAWVD